MFEKIPEEDNEMINTWIDLCGVLDCKNKPEFWSEELNIYICNEHKKKMDNKINEKMGIT